MTPERWRALNDIFHAATELPASEVDAYLERVCRADAEMLSEVRLMLREKLRPGLLDQPIIARTIQSEESAFAAGQIAAGRYRIIRFLNRGGMGEVYEAEDLELREHVALKTLLPSIADDARMIARFKQELQLSRKIGHPNVCRVFDLARHPSDASSPATYFLTMEFLAGETLAAHIHRSGRFSCAEALPLLAQMADALDAAHQNGVIHRDFKPSNVMLVPAAESWRAVVTDFGLARKTVSPEDATITLTRTLVGTLDYMAPELLTGSSASPASDIHALGLVAYKMVTGELPFASSAPLQAAIRRGKERIPPVSASGVHLEPQWHRALLRALDPDPTRRFRTARDFVQSLCGKSIPVTVRLPLRTPRQWAVAVLIFLGAFGVWAAWRIRQDRAARPSREAQSFYQTGLADIHEGAYFAATKALGETVRLAPGFSLAHARLAEAWMELQLPEKSQEEMLRAQREDSARLPDIARLQIAATSLTVTRDFDAAVQKFEEITRIAGPEDEGASIDLGRAYIRAGKPDRALGVLRRVAEGPMHSPAAWLWLGILYARRSEAAQSARAFDEAERRYQITSNLEGLTQVADERGIAAYRAGQLAASAAFYQKALETAHEAGNVEQEIRAKLQLSTSAYLSGNASAAERYANDALEEAQTNQMEVSAISGIVNLGNACNERRDLPCAERNYQDALARSRRAGSARMTALAQLSLASLHYDSDRYSDAVNEARQALSYYQTNRFAEETLQALTILGRADYHRGNDASALDTFRRLLALAEKAQNRPQMALAHENIGLLYASEQRYPEALGEYRKNQELSSGPIRVAYAELQSGDMLWMLGRSDEAESLFSQADAVAAHYAPLKLNLLRARANLALSRNSYRRAAELARAALDDKRVSPGNQVHLQSILGVAWLRSGRPSDGLRSCEEALSGAGKLSDDLVRLTAHLAVLEARLATGRRQSALALFHEAESSWSRFPESRWRALALVASVDRRYREPARLALNQLSAQWGSEVFSRYQERPDVKKLAGPLLASPNVKH